MGVGIYLTTRNETVALLRSNAMQTSTPNIAATVHDMDSTQCESVAATIGLRRCDKAVTAVRDNGDMRAFRIDEAMGIVCEPPKMTD